METKKVPKVSVCWTVFSLNAHYCHGQSKHIGSRKPYLSAIYYCRNHARAEQSLSISTVCGSLWTILKWFYWPHIYNIHMSLAENKTLHSTGSGFKKNLICNQTNNWFEITVQHFRTILEILGYSSILHQLSVITATDLSSPSYLQHPSAALDYTCWQLQTHAPPKRTEEPCFICNFYHPPADPPADSARYLYPKPPPTA